MQKKQKGLILLLTMYRASSYDVIFFYPIQIVFLYKCRGITLAQNVFLESCFWVFNFIMMSVATIIISKKLTAKQATVVGSILWILATLMYLMPASEYYFNVLILAEAVRALGLGLKTVADFQLIRETLEVNHLYTNQNQKNYMKVEGNAMAINCAGDAIMSLMSVPLMNINRDLPMWMCLISCIYGLSLSIILPNSSKVAIQRNVEGTYKQILSNRVVFTIILHATILYGTLCYWEGLGKNLLQETSISTWGYGIVIAMLYIANSIGGAIAEKILEIFKSKKQYIKIVTITNLVSFVVLGIMGILNTRISIIVIAVILALQAMVKTAYTLAIKTSLQKQQENAAKTINLLCSSEHIGKAVVLACASGIVDITSTAICYVVLGVVLLFPCIFLNNILEMGEA